eukprot:TRINITY_DN23995_c0_g1_i4.p1 TRINITY_DN23995_c0_g1~~TRINITY_DN23995_c0_g1_i4.p1  ORF type:complete len:295 (+),score=54.52 TRINITY_DN23995_c0_g1_i4:580-1464(+)
MRTVYLPAANADALMLKLESVQAQLNEQQQFANERISALLEDRRIREQDYEAHIANYAHQIEQLTAKLGHAEEALRQTTKDYIVAKKEKQEAESQLAEETEKVNYEKQNLSRKLEQMKENNKKIRESEQKDGETKMEECVANFRQQIHQKENEIANLKQTLSQSDSYHVQRQQELEGKVQKVNKRCAELEHRRALDLEGFTNDVSMLRKQLAAVNRRLHQMRILDRLEDEDKLEELLGYLERRAPDVRQISDDRSEVSNSSQTAEDLRKIRQALNSLDDKIRAKKKESTRYKCS